MNTVNVVWIGEIGFIFGSISDFGGKNEGRYDGQITHVN